MVPRFSSLKHFVHARKAYLTFVTPFFHWQTDHANGRNIYRWVPKKPISLEEV